MFYQLTEKTYAVRLEIGEEILACLTELCVKENIRYAEVSGIGAVKSATVGLYNVEEQKYYSRTLEQPMEMVSLTGSVTDKSGEVYLHLHACFSDEECRAFGGHLNSAVIGVTAEVFVRRLDGSLGRRIHPETGLNIFDLPKAKTI